jgi:hypothetical protein
MGQVWMVWMSSRVWGKDGRYLENPWQPRSSPRFSLPQKIAQTQARRIPALLRIHGNLGKLVVYFGVFPGPRSFARATTVKTSLIAATVPSARRGCNQLCMQVTVPPGDRSRHATSTSGTGKDMEVDKVGARCLLSRDFPNSEEG